MQDTTVQFIAEIGTAHAGSLSLAKEHIAAVKECGAHMAKFQWIIADEIVSKHVGNMHFSNGQFDLYHNFKQVERDIDFYLQLQAYAISLDVRFLCSVFGLQSHTQYMQLHPSIIKVASPEINHIPLLRELSQNNGIHIIISTGLASLVDIEQCLTLLTNKTVEQTHTKKEDIVPLHSNTISLLHCVTTYPAQYNEYNLAVLPLYKELFTHSVGISDHSNTIALLAATSMLFGAKIIEKHFCLESKINSPDTIDAPVTLTPRQFTTMIETCKQIESLLSAKAHENEAIHLLKEIAAQESIEKNNTKTHYDITTLLEANAWISPPLRDIYTSSRRSLFRRSPLRKENKVPFDEIENWVPLRSEKNITPGLPAEYLQYIH